MSSPTAGAWNCRHGVDGRDYCGECHAPAQTPTISPALAEAASHFWHGEHGHILPDATYTKYGCDGGSYTLRGTQISGDGGSGIIYIDDNGRTVIQFNDGSGGRIADNGNGTWTFTGDSGTHIFGAPTKPEPTEYEKVIGCIERTVAALNEALGLSTEFDADMRRNCVTFGHIGMLQSWGDDRLWEIFLPHPGRVGTAGDSIGSFRTGDLDGARNALAQAGGALRLARWQRHQAS